ncbi:MAG: hypothetical protein ACRETY_08775 [Steroidobacteraceae bacterium]
MSLLELRSIGPGTDESAGDVMLHQNRWEEVRRLHFAEHQFGARFTTTD